MSFFVNLFFFFNFASACGAFRLQTEWFHGLKRAFPLSSFRSKLPISKNEDERHDTPPVCVSYAWPTPLLEHIRRRQICFYLFVLGCLAIPGLRWVRTYPYAFSCAKYKYYWAIGGSGRGLRFWTERTTLLPLASREVNFLTICSPGSIKDAFPQTGTINNNIDACYARARLCGEYSFS